MSAMYLTFMSACMPLWMVVNSALPVMQWHDGTISCNVSCSILSLVSLNNLLIVSPLLTTPKALTELSHMVEVSLTSDDSVAGSDANCLYNSLILGL